MLLAVTILPLPATASRNPSDNQTAYYPRNSRTGSCPVRSQSTNSSSSLTTFCICKSRRKGVLPASPTLLLVQNLKRRRNSDQYVANFYFCVVCRDGVSLCLPGCPETLSVDQAGLKHRNPPASASLVLELSHHCPAQIVASFTLFSMGL